MGAFISGSNVIIAARGDDGVASLVSAETFTPSREAGRLPPVCGGLLIRKAWCFAYQVSALCKDLPDTGCLYSKSPDRNTSSAFEVSAAASGALLLVKAVTSTAEKLLEKVLTFFCGFR
jgi:hypothetical protein